MLFHYDRDVGQQTLIGGVLTIASKAIVFYIAISKGIGMIQHENPSLLSVMSGVIEEDNITAKVSDVH